MQSQIDGYTCGPSAPSGSDGRMVSCAVPVIALAPCNVPFGSPVGIGVTVYYGGQSCWRDHLARAEPEAVLW